jgi:hypothetical protein
LGATPAGFRGRKTFHDLTLVVVRGFTSIVEGLVGRRIRKHGRAFVVVYHYGWGFASDESMALKVVFLVGAWSALLPGPRGVKARESRGWNGRCDTSFRGSNLDLYLRHWCRADGITRRLKMADFISDGDKSGFIKVHLWRRLDVRYGFLDYGDT